MQWVELAPFLDSGVAMLGASADQTRRPEVFRIWGATIDDGCRVRVLANADACQTFESVQKGSRLAAVFTDITTFRSVQVKGAAIAAPLAPSAADMAVFRRYDERFGRSLETIGHPLLLRDRLRPLAVIVLEVAVDAIFDQTPGPRAGAQVPG